MPTSSEHHAQQHQQHAWTSLESDDSLILTRASAAHPYGWAELSQTQTQSQQPWALDAYLRPQALQLLVDEVANRRRRSHHIRYAGGVAAQRRGCLALSETLRVLATSGRSSTRHGSSSSAQLVAASMSAARNARAKLARVESATRALESAKTSDRIG